MYHSPPSRKTQSQLAYLVHSFVHPVLVCLVVHTTLLCILFVHSPSHPPFISGHILSALPILNTALASGLICFLLIPPPILPYIFLPRTRLRIHVTCILVPYFETCPSSSMCIWPLLRLQSYCCSRIIHMHFSNALSTHARARAHASCCHLSRPMPFILPGSICSPPCHPHASMS